MRILRALLILALLAAPARASLSSLMLFTGTLRGETNLTGLPPLTWIFSAAPAAENRKTALLALKAAGLDLRARLALDQSSGALTWHIDDARLHLAPLAPHAAPSLSTITFSGELRLSGSGTIINNRPHGRLAISCVNASASDAIAGWTLTGIDFSGEFSLGENLAIASATPATLRIQTIATSRFGARNFSASGHLLNTSRASISHAKVEIAGGEVETLEPFTVPLSPPSIAALIQIRRVGLQDFIALLPSGLADARGKLNGELRLTWNEIEGIQLGIGTLALDEIEPTVIRLASSPGFLTGNMPARLELLPGFLGKIFSVRNPSYPDLQKIELGRTELEVSALRIQLSPDGDARHRTAHAEIDARPLQPGSVIKRVTFDINVTGPLTSLFRLGFNHPFNITVR